LLVKTFHEHPGFSVSEDWFFGHVARQLGCRIKMCSHVFVETETPTAVFRSGGGSRGGFGEMTIFQQRFKRWNFFFVNGMWYNMHYILGSWRLGRWELGAKMFVLQEVIAKTPSMNALTRLTDYRFMKRSSTSSRHSYYQYPSLFDPHFAPISSLAPSLCISSTSLSSTRST
jgi:hypothetical protein